MNKTKLFLSVLTVVTLIFNTSSQAADIVWTNSAGGMWNNATNWSPNQIPAAGDVAIVTNAGTYTITNNATVTISSIVLGIDPGTNASTVLPRLRHTAGTLTVTNFSIATNALFTMSAAVTVPGTLACAGQIDHTAAALRLFGANAINIYNFSGGEQRGGTLTVTNLNWTDGNLNADANGDKVIIPPGGVLNQLGNATRNLSYYPPATRGRDIDNHGTWNWSGDSLLYGVNPAVVNNYGSVEVTGTGSAQFLYYPGYSAPTWNNFGTFHKSIGTNYFYFQGVYLNNNGALNVGAGTLSIYGSTFTNLAGISLSVSGKLVNESSSTTTMAPGGFFNSPSGDHFSVLSGNVYLQTTNLFTPSVRIAGGTLHQQTNNVVPTINQASGTWRLYVTTAVDTYNLNGGDLRGGTLTVTNLNWVNGNMNADANGDKTIIPVGGVLNFPGDVTRYLSYNSPATRGRDLDNHGTWNWSGNSLLYGVHPAVVNNYGAVNVTGSGTAQFLYAVGYSAPTWNNFGTFTKTVGTNYFYFQGVYLNNSGSLAIQSGNLSLYNSTSGNSGTVNVANGIFQIYGGTATNSSSITLSPTSILQTDNSAALHLLPSTALSAPAANSIRLNSGTTYLASTNISSPSILISGGTLVQQTNIVVATINQSAGGLQLAVPAFLETYNLTNGLLRGSTLTVTNFNWIAGHQYADANGDKTIIPEGGVLNMSGNTTRALSYNPPATAGRGLDNYGTWNWTGDCLLQGVHPAVVNNYGAVNVTGAGTSQFTYVAGYSSPTWNNFGTFTKSVGTNYFYFTACYLNNMSLLKAQSGKLAFHAAVVTNSTGLIQIAPTALLFSENNNTLHLLGESQLVSPGYNNVRLDSGTVYIGTTNLVTPSLALNGATVVQQTNIVVSDINQVAGTFQLAVSNTLANYNFTNGTLRGRTLVVTNFNWIAGHQYADANGDKTIIPEGGVLNMSGNTTRALSYNPPATAGRGLDNYGTWNWTGDCLLQGVHPAVVNNYGAVNVTGAGTSQFTYVAGYSSPTWNNFGTFTKSVGTNYFYFTACYLNNTNLIDVQSGKLAFHAAVTTNTSTAKILLSEAALLFNENNNTATFEAGTILAGASPDSFRIVNGTVYLRSMGISVPSISLAGGTLWQEVENVVPQINQSGGAWRLAVPTGMILTT